MYVAHFDADEWFSSQYGLDLDQSFEAQIGTHSRKPWSKFVTSGAWRTEALSA